MAHCHKKCSCTVGCPTITTFTATYETGAILVTGTNLSCVVAITLTGGGLITPVTLPIRPTQTHMIFNVGIGLLVLGSTLTVKLFSCVKGCPLFVAATTVVQSASPPPPPPPPCPLVPSAAVQLQADLQAIIDTLTIETESVRPLLTSIQIAVGAIVVDANPCCAFLLSPYFACIAAYSSAVAAALPVIIFPELPGVYTSLATALGLFDMSIGMTPVPSPSPAMCPSVCSQLGPVVGNLLLAFNGAVEAVIAAGFGSNPPPPIASALATLTGTVAATANVLFSTPCASIGTVLAGALGPIDAALAALITAVMALPVIVTILTALGIALDNFSICLVNV